LRYGNRAGLCFGRDRRGPIHGDTGGRANQVAAFQSAFLRFICDRLLAASDVRSSRTGTPNSSETVSIVERFKGLGEPWADDPLKEQ